MDSPTPPPPHVRFRQPHLAVRITGITLIVCGLVISLLSIGSNGIHALITFAGIWVLVVGYATPYSRLIAAFLWLIAPIGLELTLLTFSYAPDYSGNRQQDMSAAFAQQAWWICDAVACHFNPAERHSHCDDEAALGVNYLRRLCIFNRDGFHDTDEFVPPDTETNRILILGDSFTWGASADIGQAWVEQLEADDPDSLIWNTGIPSTGTRQALSVLTHYLPIMQPNLVILGFYPGNDFTDNLYPLDTFTVINNELTRQYLLDADFAPVRLTADEAFFLSRHEVAPPTRIDDFRYFLQSTRVGTLASRLLNRVQWRAQAEWEHAVALTYDLLVQLRDTAQIGGTQLLVVLIPDRDDLTSTTDAYNTAIAILDELGIPYIDPRAALTMGDYAPLPDNHWNNQGHGTIAGLVSASMQSLNRSPE